MNNSIINIFYEGNEYRNPYQYKLELPNKTKFTKTFGDSHYYTIIEDPDSYYYQKIQDIFNYRDDYSNAIHFYGITIISIYNSIIHADYIRSAYHNTNNNIDRLIKKLNNYTIIQVDTVHNCICGAIKILDVYASRAYHVHRLRYETDYDFNSVVYNNEITNIRNDINFLITARSCHTMENGMDVIVVNNDDGNKVYKLLNRLSDKNALKLNSNNDIDNLLYDAAFIESLKHNACRYKLENEIYNADNYTIKVNIS